MNTSGGTEAIWQFKLLGGCEITRRGSPVHLESAKTKALLIYLALNPEPQPRLRLMGLLWGDLPETNARRNLRRALWNIRRELRAAEIAFLLWSEGDSIAFIRNPSIRLDITDFETACSPTHTRKGESRTEAVELERLQTAVDIYQGDFLQGFFVKNALEFEEWVVTQRERFRLLALLALEALAKRYAEAEPDLALIFAKRLLGMEPWREDIHRFLMRLYARLGQTAAALTQFETCRRLLSEDLKVLPAAETINLYKQIKADRLVPQAASLPAPTTRFIGRECELSKIHEILSGQNCRLLTLLGPGGVGKTRLAIAAAASLAARFADGIVFVSLAPLQVADHIWPALTTALKIQVGGGHSLESEVIHYLEHREMLLVLDNFEHLLPEGGVINKLLTSAPGLTILATSRQRLFVKGEWLFEVSGLQIPDTASDPNFDKSGSVSLFLQTSRQVQSGCQLKQNERSALLALCRLVDGLPLALEMAAAWSRNLTITEIVREIDRDLDFLMTEWKDVPDRHTSLRATFEHSWRLLTHTEQAALCQLSQFRSEFTTQAAHSITAVPFKTMLALVDKSMLQRVSGGRFAMHSSVRHYAAEKCKKGEAEAVNKKHSSYYSQLLSQIAPHFLNNRIAEAVEQVTAEIGNIRQAWRWAGQHTHYAALSRALTPLYHFYDTVGWFEEGIAAFEDVIGFLEPDNQPLLVGQLAVGQAVLCRRQGDLTRAHQLLTQALNYFEQAEATADKADTFNQLGNLADVSGDFAEAERYFGRSLALWQEKNDRLGVAKALNNLGLAAFRLGRFVESEQYYQRSLAIKEEMGNAWGTAVSLDNLANTLLAQGRLQEADDHFRRSLRLAHRLHAASLTLEILAGLAELAILRQQIQLALEIICAIQSHPAVASETNHRAARLETLISNQLDQAVFDQYKEKGLNTSFPSILDKFLT